MIRSCKTSHTEELMDLLDRMSSCLSEIGEQLELLGELREEIEGEVEDYTDDVDALETALGQCEDELSESRRTALSETEKKAILQKMFLFDAVTPMTSSERISVYNWILSDECSHDDICWEAGNYLKEIRKADHPFNEELPFEKIYSESAANLL